MAVLQSAEQSTQYSEEGFNESADKPSVVEIVYIE